jgi:hypothetical protein
MLHSAAMTGATVAGYISSAKLRGHVRSFLALSLSPNQENLCKASIELLFLFNALCVYYNTLKSKVKRKKQSAEEIKAPKMLPEPIKNTENAAERFACRAFPHCLFLQLLIFSDWLIIMTEKRGREYGNSFVSGTRVLSDYD